ncbi:hypothetical protein D3C73_1331850 [compost metagenome]
MIFVGSFVLPKMVAIAAALTSGALNVFENCSAKKVLPAPAMPTMRIRCGLDRLNDFIYDSIANVGSYWIVEGCRELATIVL